MMGLYVGWVVDESVGRVTVAGASPRIFEWGGGVESSAAGSEK